MTPLRNFALYFTLFCCFRAAASTSAEQPGIITISPLYGGGLKALSANGRWAVGDASNPENGLFPAFPRIVETATGETIELFSESEGLQNAAMGATCISNDGKTVGGSYDGLPAVWTEEEGWMPLPLPASKFNTGTVSAMTPDGNLCVGRVSMDFFNEYPCLWDVREMKLLPLPGIMTSNPRYLDLIEHGGNPDEWTDADINVRLTGISADGNSLLGMVDFCYPASAWEFLYDREAGKWTALGMEFDGTRLRSLDPDMQNVEECIFSADGRYVAGTYFSESDSNIPILFQTDDPNSFTAFPDSEGVGIWAVGTDATLYGSTPYSTPVRNWGAKVGKYWYDWKAVVRQLYGIDWMADITKDELGLSGTVVGVSADNLKILAVDCAQNISYIITLPSPLASLCSDVDLLADYRCYPPADAEFSLLESVRLDFGYNIEVKGEKFDAYLCDADGNKVRASINMSVPGGTPNRLEVLFRYFKLEAGKDYKAVIPAGSFCIAGDPDRMNEEIVIPYRGREAGAVCPIAVSPADGSELDRINLTTNPISITFNATLMPLSDPSVSLWQIKDDSEEYLFPLNSTIDGNRMLLYPAGEVRLAKGTAYRIDVAAGCVADLSGAGANEAFSISYSGAFTPEIDPSSNIVYSNDFNMGVAGMLLFEGDHNTPSPEMAAWGFESDNTPWMPVRDDDDTDGNYAAAAHSSFDPAGQAEDWMVCPQIYLPDDKAKLIFKAQSHKNAKNDLLKVYVWESDDVLTTLTRNAVDKIHYNGELVFNRRLLPGADEDRLAGDWDTYQVDLGAYAGKFIYIAFLNDNRNQSAVFIDDIVVSRETSALLSIDTEPTLVDADNAVIKGRFLATKPEGISSYKLILCDAAGTEINTIASDTPIACGETCEFSFPEVALAKGKTNTFSVALQTDGEILQSKIDLRNLLFKTTKRSVIEEFTGTTCQFCPQGIIATEYLQQLFGDAVIPIAIHSYTGDQFGGMEQTAYSSFLGLNAAPSASVDRGASSNPMWSDGTDYFFTSPDGNTWLEKTQQALARLPIADLTVVSAEADEKEKTVKTHLSVDYAIDVENTEINIFGVVMEDGLEGFQTNGLYNTSAPGLGEWGKGGAYAKSRVRWVYDDVVRSTSALPAGDSYSGFNGRGGYLPTSIAGGETATADFAISLPSSPVAMENLKVCIMLIDAKTGSLINAAVSRIGGSGATPAPDSTRERANVYDMMGRLMLPMASQEEIHQLPAGIYIRAGKKIKITL